MYAIGPGMLTLP